MRVYYKNWLKTAAMSASPLSDGHTIADVVHPFLSRFVLFSSNTVAITAAWGSGRHIDSVAFVNCNFTSARIRLKNQGQTVFSGTAYYASGVSIFKMPQKYFVTDAAIEIDGQENIELGYLFAGERTELPLFQAAPGASLELSGKAEQTSSGQVYGLKWPALRSFSASFADVSNGDRQKIIEYIRAVQEVEPHVIEPYDAGEFPPIYGTLTGCGEFSKREGAGFCFDTKLSWRESA